MSLIDSEVTKVRVGNKDYHMKFTLRVAKTIEEKYSKSIDSFVSSLAESETKTSDICELVYLLICAGERYVSKFNKKEYVEFDIDEILDSDIIDMERYIDAIREAIQKAEGKSISSSKSKKKAKKKTIRSL